MVYTMYWRGDKLGTTILEQFKGKVLRTYPKMLMMKRKKIFEAHYE